MDTIQKNLISKVKELENKQLITDRDRLVITGLTYNGGMKAVPGFQTGAVINNKED